MKTDLRSSLSTGLFKIGLVSALLLVPLLAHEQTFYGSGGSTNTAPYVFNVALGYLALNANTSGYYNTAIGTTALVFNTTGLSNTATGFDALYNSTTGGSNTANGVD